MNLQLNSHSKHPQKWIVVCIVAGLILVICISTVGALGLFDQSVPFEENVLYDVAHVEDGDTFDISVKGKLLTIRMLGIDTPETVDPRKGVQCYGPEASTETKRLLTDRKVKLVLNPDRETHDKYGRYLAFIYRDDGLFVNKYLIENGFAHEYTFGTAYMYQKEFRRIETKAKSSKVGLWGRCDQRTTSH